MSLLELLDHPPRQMHKEGFRRDYVGQERGCVGERVDGLDGGDNI